MFKNYFHIAWRNLWGNKSFSLINIAGLAIGMACTMLILIWVYNERSWDQFNANYKNIYHVFSNRNFNGEITTGPDMMYPLAKTVKAEIPEVEHAAVVTFGEQTLFSAGDKSLYKNTVTASPDLVDIFSFKFIAGAPSAIFETDAVLLTKSSAIALFGNTNIIGQPLRVNNGRTAYVKAVIDDIPRNATLQLDAILPFNTSSPQVKAAEQEWVNCNDRVFVQARAGANVAGLEKKIHQVVKAHTKRDNPTTRGSVLLHPMSKWRLYEEFKDGKNTGGRIQYVHLFNAIAIIILVIACVNFMNLSTARAGKRAKEIGIRKTLGSVRYQLLWQFMAESILLSFIAFLMALLILVVVLPAFGNLLNIHLLIPFNEPALWAVLTLIILGTGLISGSYPAIYLSGFNPVKVLKGTFQNGRQGAMPRKVLVTAQFIVSIILISATLIIYQQLQHVKNRDIGYNPDNMLMVRTSPSTNKNFTAFKNDLLRSGMVEGISRSSGPITELLGFTSGIRWTGAPVNLNLVIGFLFAEEDFLNTLHARLVEGRDFGSGDTNNVLFNKEAIRLMGISSPVGKTINWAGRDRTIVGVFDNLVVGSPYEAATPLMIAYGNNGMGNINIRLTPQANIKKAVPFLENTYKKFSTGYPFEYRFVNEAFNLKYSNEQLIGTLSVIAAALAIFICCLGLFGLVSFTIEKRTREIGIRKVLGASVQQLLLMISKEFLVLVGIAFLIAIPAAWWAMNEWLQHFSYRITLSAGVFVLVGFAILLIAWLTVSLNASRAALTKPANTLRME